MGEYADMVINGEVCQFCLEPLSSDNGYPSTCAGCMQDEVEEKPKDPKVKCPTCGKRVKPTGLEMHCKVVHGEKA